MEEKVSYRDTCHISKIKNERFPPLSLHQRPLGVPTGSDHKGSHWPSSAHSLALSQPVKSAMLRLQCGCNVCFRAHTHRDVTKAHRGQAYLCDRLLIPHGRLLDEVTHSYIPISTRNDHPGPPETHCHFHFSSAALIPMRKKTRQNAKKHPRSAKGYKNKSQTVAKKLEVKLPLCPESSKDKREAQHWIQRRGWVASSLCRVDSLTETSQQKASPARAHKWTDSASAPTC